jgi:DNA-binding NarL/FixJ family response regulator
MELINIALAEDQTLFRECLASNIRNFANMNVAIEAANGKELLEKISLTTQKPDIVLMDLDMPVMNGMETLQHLREMLPDVKIIILSVHGEEGYIVRMVQKGINGYLVKTADLEEVRKAIETAYTKGFYFNDAVIRILQSGALQKKQKIKDYEINMSLTSREREILDLICKEYTNSEIAEKLFLSVRTIDGHRTNLLEKTGARNTAGLVAFALRHNLVYLDV